MRVFLCTVVAGGLLLAPRAPLYAQTSAYASLEGDVRGASGSGINQAVVTLRPVGRESPVQTVTDPSGAFAFRLVRPGIYELRIEALGYRPLVAPSLRLVGGEERRIVVSLNAEQPPVLTVDTMFVPSGIVGRWQAGTMRLGAVAIEGVPHRRRGLSSLATLSTVFDGSLGALGLTGNETVVVADGLPFYRASHPTALSDVEPMPLFPSAFLGSVALSTTPEIDMPGAAGGWIEVNTSPALSGPIEASAAYSSEAMWSSDRLLGETPSLMSLDATFRGVVPLRDDGSQLLVSADVLRHQTPTPARIEDGLAADLDFLGSEVVAALNGVGRESYSRYSGLARLDLDQGTEGRLFVRGAGSFVQRLYDGAGALPTSHGIAPSEESTDLSLAAGYVTSVSRATSVDLRAGVSASSREFMPDVEYVSNAHLVQSGAVLSGPSFAPGESSRTDVVLIPSLTHLRGRSEIRAGLSIRVANQTARRGLPEQTTVAFSDPSALAAGRGYYERLSSSEASVGSQEYGLFGQYEVAAGEGLSLRVGARLDRERIDPSGPTPNEEWREATGLRNEEVGTGFNKVALVGGMTWTSPSGGTMASVSASLRGGDLDPRAVFEVHALADGGVQTTFAGTGVEWPGGEVPVGAVSRQSLALFGPDLRVPRSETFSLALTQRALPSVTLLVQGTVRRTDFLLRRRNLNLPLDAPLEDQYGRAVYGSLQKDGGLLTATGADVRRFPAFGDVWALDPDGWSEYRGVTFGVEHASERLELFAAYTFSNTRDNRVGAASGDPNATLSPGLADTGDGTPWDEGTSDFDVPHRFAGGITLRGGPVEFSGVYQYRSGLPYTPGYRFGVDANGDASVHNDVAYVPSTEELGDLLAAWPCLGEQAGGFAVRNSCRGPDEHGLSLRLEARIAVFGSRSAYLVLDGLDLIESRDGVIDRALLLVDPDSTLGGSSGSTVTVPVRLNDAFDTVRYPSTRGRMLRIGLRVGG